MGNLLETIVYGLLIGGAVRVGVKEVKKKRRR